MLFPVTAFCGDTFFRVVSRFTQLIFTFLHRYPYYPQEELNKLIWGMKYFSLMKIYLWQVSIVGTVTHTPRNLSQPILETRTVLLQAGGTGHWSLCEPPHVSHPGCGERTPGTSPSPCCRHGSASQFIPLSPECLEQLSGTGAYHQCPIGPICICPYVLARDNS